MSNIASISVKVKTEMTAPSACEMAILTCAQQENSPDFPISSYSSWAFPSQPNFTVRYYDAGLGRFVGRDPYDGSEELAGQTPLAFAMRGLAFHFDYSKYDMTFLMMAGGLIAGMQYSDGMNLYMSYFAVNGFDPTGEGFWSVVGNFVAGAVVGVAVAAAVVVAAPVVVAGLVAVGVTTTVASAVVTTTIGVAAVAGAITTYINTQSAIQSGNYNQAAFNLGSLAGGLTLGASGGPLSGRALAGLGGTPSTVPRSWNPFGDIGMGYNSNYPGGSITGWLGSAPTPQSGGFSLGAIGSGASSLINTNSDCD